MTGVDTSDLHFLPEGISEIAANPRRVFGDNVGQSAAMKLAATLPYTYFEVTSSSSIYLLQDFVYYLR